MVFEVRVELHDGAPYLLGPPQRIAHYDEGARNPATLYHVRTVHASVSELLDLAERSIGRSAVIVESIRKQLYRYRKEPDGPDTP